jgi:hypothetical protein
MDQSAVAEVRLDACFLCCSCWSLLARRWGDVPSCLCVCVCMEKRVIERKYQSHRCFEVTAYTVLATGTNKTSRDGEHCTSSRFFHSLLGSAPFERNETKFDNYIRLFRKSTGKVINQIEMVIQTPFSSESHLPAEPNPPSFVPEQVSS